jgi:formamidopyrimidine-DNA glycosylase
LMDQRVLAGLGNMLSDEVLWRAGIPPRTHYRELAMGERRALHRVLREVLGRAVSAGSIPRRKGWLTRERDEVEPLCPKGHGPLERTRLGGRTALWCRVCQRQR